ncbi:unnamed protein product, partial [Didymodactylos carnosus]
MGRSLVRVR